MGRSCPPEWKPLVLAEWPKQDQSAWTWANREADPLDLAPALAAHLRQSTRRQYERGYGCWLRWLTNQRALDDAEPGARATVERVKAYYEEMLEHGYAGYTIADRLVALAQVLKSIDPARDYGWISLAARRIHRNTRPVKDIRGALQPSGSLLQLGLELMDEAADGRFRKPLDRAIRYRDGLMIALLAKRPIRVGNLAIVVVGEHLRQVHGGWSLSFEAHEVKNKRPFTCRWPADLNQALEYYLAEIRPGLVKGGPDEAPMSLWLSANGLRMRPGDILVRVKHWTTQRFGRALTPHNFRHSAATTMAIASPKDAGEIAAILGHSKRRISDDHYNLATSLEAAERCQAELADRRRRLGVRKRSAPENLSLLDLRGRHDYESHGGHE